MKHLVLCVDVVVKRLNLKSGHLADYVEELY